MSDDHSAPRPLTDAAPQFLPPLLLLFVGSGCSALVYEIVWFQLLQLVIGSSAVSLGVLLATFMGGMCLGSLVLPRVISARRHPLRVYAFLELGIGAIGVTLLFVMPHVGRLYTSAGGAGHSDVALRAVVAGLCLLPPTVLMGATLPAIARWVESTPQGVARLGFFYASNIAGAVFGCLLAGFYLLRVHDMATATYVAAGINLTVAVLSLVLAARSCYRRAAAESTGDSPVVRAPDAWTIYLAICLSGLTALGAEVVWTRQLSLLLGASVYTFSIILAVFLGGLGVGSAVGSHLSATQPRTLLGWCQLLLTAAIAWSAYAISGALPYLPVDPELGASPWIMFQLDLMRCMWAVLPASLLWGASFPLALAAAARRDQDPGRLVGGVYAANTVGAIAGAIGFSMLSISWLGTQGSQQLLIVLCVLSSLLVLGPPLLRLGAAAADSDSPSKSPVKAWAAAQVLLALLATALTWSAPEAPAGLIAFGRKLATSQPEPEYLYVGEGANASIAVSEYDPLTRYFHVSGKTVASSEPYDMRLQLMLGHLPALLHPHPRNVLVVGCGAGVTAGTFLAHPDVERVVICEIEPLIPQAAQQHFGLENSHVLDDPRVQVVIDDARHYLLKTDERFDIITSDPIHPWVKGAAALYSQEYFELCRQRLNPGGLTTQWVPLYETSLAAVKSEIATFFRVFPEGTIWNNEVDNAGYDIVLLGGSGSPEIDLDQMQQRLQQEDYQLVQQSLEQVELGDALSLLLTYAGRAADLKPWLADAQLNRDSNLRLQYLAGLGLNLNRSAAILDSMLEYRRYPEGLFVASSATQRELRKLLDVSAAE